jgi:3-hydroxyisobutyrate dehydrogenase-like beta-hydroxyacid dehydrogenase
MSADAGSGLVNDVIGFIGVGAMGSSVASRLVRGHEVLVNDRNPDAAAELVAAGARFAAPAEIAASCRTVFLCLPGPPQVRDLLLGADGLAQSLEPGSVVIDITTGTPIADAEIVSVLAERGVDYVDSPIAGGVRRAREGTAALMVGAEPDVFARIEPLLREITSEVVRVGPVGAGHAMKLVNNLLNACNRFAALETIRLGVAAGMDQDVVVDVINRSSGRNYATEYTFPQLLSGDSWKPQGFTLQLMLKDIRLATELGDSLGHETPIGDLAEMFTELAIERFGPGSDQSQMMAEWYAADGEQRPEA